MIQPADETPLIPVSWTPDVPAVAAAVPGLLAEVQGARAEVVQAARDLCAELFQQLQAAKSGIVTAATAQGAALGEQLGNAYGGVRTQIDRMGKKILDRIDGAEAGLYAEGVVTPLTTAEREADLAAGSYDPFAARYARTIIAGRMPDTPDVVAPPPPPPDFVDPPAPGIDYLNCIPATMVLAPGVGLVPQCPPDRVAVAVAGGAWVCCLRVATSFDPPVSPPPPPAVPPVVPPITGPPIDPGNDPCNPPTGPAVQVNCFQLPPAPIEWKYWVTIDCSDCYRPKACVWKGVNPPIGYAGDLVGSVWTIPPTQAELEGLVKLCAVSPPASPPASPPPPPPTVPGVPPPPPPGSPPVCETYAESYADDLLGSWTAAAANDESCNVTIAPPNFSPLNGWTAYTDCSPNHDKVITDLENRAGQIVTNQGGTSSTVTDWMRAWFYVTPGMNTLSNIIEDGGSEKNLAAIKKISGEAVDTANDAVAAVLDHVTGRTVQHKRAVLAIGSAIGVGSLLERTTGFPLSYHMMSQTYLMQYANPQYIPGQSDLDALYIFNRITNDQWTCFTKANGNQPDLFRPVRNTKEVQPGINEVLQLWLRGHLPDDGQVDERLRNLGVIRPEFKGEYKALTEWMPQPQDLIRFMTRDVWDPRAVAKYGLDDEFTEKYPGDAEKMGRAVGLAKDVAKYEWRAHWRIPSDTALYTMLHRLRPTRAEVVEWDKNAAHLHPAAALAQFGPRPPVLTKEDVTDALKLNDNLPSMVERLVAISYRPITNTDAARMHEIGYFTDAQLASAIEDNGATASDAVKLTGFYKAQKSRRLSNDTGVFTGRKIIAAFKGGSISRQQADALLAEKILDQALRTRTLDNAELEVEVETQQTQAKALKKRYMYGEFDSNTLATGLQSIGLEQIAINATVRRWEAERMGRAKEPRVTMLCQWRDAGFITPAEHFERLTRLGYNADDAGRISQLCESQNLLKRTKAAVAAAEKQRREAERALRREKENLEGRIQELKSEVSYWEQVAAGVRP